MTPTRKELKTVIDFFLGKKDATTICAPACDHFPDDNAECTCGAKNAEEILSRLTDEALAQDEKRRAALEKVEKAARRYKRTGVCHSRCGSGPADGLIPQLGYGDCTCGNDALAEALTELDALDEGKS